MSEPEIPPQAFPEAEASEAAVRADSFPFRFPGWLPPLFYLLLGFVFLWKSLIGGDVFLPASLLGHIAPWKNGPMFHDLPAWNPLRWDGIGQFYPWRHFAAVTIRSGRIPLWNPYQFSGTPFVANSQSAVLYPGNLVFYLIPDTATAFAWNALLHLTLCGWFTYLLLRRLRCSAWAAMLGGVVYAYSAWQIVWLQLPTFLATSCWIPLLLRQVEEIGSSRSNAGMDSKTPVKTNGEPAPPEHGGLPHPVSDASAPVDLRSASHLSSHLVSRLSACVSLSAVIGMMLLAGHLQIAFYGLLAGALRAVWLLSTEPRKALFSRLALFAAALVLGFLPALPQLLPSIELSHMSHRAGKPSREGYTAYTEYGLPPDSLTMLFLPNFFGGDTDPANPYWGFYTKRLGPEKDQVIGIRHNPAETAVYIGIVPLFLAAFACMRGLKRRSLNLYTVFFAVLALAALLLAFGTPLNALLYFGIPGFGQSGSPARCLVLWSLAGACLSALGLDALFQTPATRRDPAIISGVLALVFALSLNAAAHAVAAPPFGLSDIPALGEIFRRLTADGIRLAIFASCGFAFLAHSTAAGRSRAVADALPAGPRAVRDRRLFFAGIAVTACVIADLFWAGLGANPTAKRSQVYPETPGIAFLRAHAGHARIFPVNQRWSLFAAPPVTLPAVLPPNAAMVFGLRDVQGYDSLFAGSYKNYATRFARPNRMGTLDSSPPEVGNMVFFQNANAPEAAQTAAAFAVSVRYDAPGFAGEAMPPSAPVELGDPGMEVYALPDHAMRAKLISPAPSAAPVWQEDAATRVTLQTSSALPARLILRDTLLPGWHAFVDGQETVIRGRPDNPVFRSAAVPPGVHTVSFRYLPASFRVGLYGACLACLLFAALGSMHVTQRRNPKIARK